MIIETHDIKGNINGHVIVDSEDYDFLNEYKWHLNDGYAKTAIKINGVWKNKKMHRLIMGEPKGMQIDHIDHNILNNCKSNLRIVTIYQNSMNRKPQKDSSSKYKGITWHKRDKKWQAQIQVNKKHIHIGSFKDEIDAVKAYNERAEELFGEYAYLNNIEITDKNNGDINV